MCAIDLTTEESIVLSWDPKIIGTDVSHIDVMLRDSEFNEQDVPILGGGITVMSNVSNSGSLNIPPATVKIRNQ